MSLTVETILVSICVPVYGVEKYIERCARSLFSQMYPNIEYIFVDDCGKDKSIENLERVIAEYPSRQNSIRIIHHEHNRGLAAARNTAVAAAKGEFIMHVDSDDWLEENAVEVLVKKQLETGADIVSGNAIAHFADREEELREPNYKSKDEMVQQTIKMSLDHVIWRRLIRKSLYDENHVQAVEGVNIGEDHHTLPKLVNYAKSIAKIDKVVYHYNCDNQDSYMGKSFSHRINIKRYYNDRDSCLILMDFFQIMEPDYVVQLQEILRDYQERMLNGALRCGDRSAYRTISKDLNKSPKNYFMLRLSTIFCKTFRKCFGISLGPLNYK